MSPGGRGIFGRRSRFHELVERQLDLFAADEASLLLEADEAERAWERVGRDESEEAYGDYQLVVDAIADRLLDVRETYRNTLEADADAAYTAAFTKAATRRFRRYATLLADLDDY